MKRGSSSMINLRNKLESSSLLLGGGYPPRKLGVELRRNCTRVDENDDDDGDDECRIYRIGMIGMIWMNRFCERVRGRSIHLILLVSISRFLLFLSIYLSFLWVYYILYLSIMFLPVAICCVIPRFYSGTRMNRFLLANR